jgi:hypothetical protein
VLFAGRVCAHWQNFKIISLILSVDRRSRVYHIHYLKKKTYKLVECGEWSHHVYAIQRIVRPCDLHSAIAVNIALQRPTGCLDAFHSWFYDDLLKVNAYR